MVRAVSFSKTYSKKSKAACADVTLSAERGKITVLLGPNGAGKSTLLKAFCAQHYATSGKVLAERSDGAIFDAAESPEEVKAMTGFVSEFPALYDDWTVIEFLEMAAALKSAAVNDGKAKKAARLCKLDSVLNQKISSLSHGYKQRVNFAQALVCDPEILILDEPATGLDPEQIREMRKLVQGLKTSRAVIFSTHIIQEAASLSDTIYIIKDGRVAASGSPSELMKKSGSKNLEDAYLFFVSDPRGSNDLSSASDFGMSNEPSGSNDYSLPNDSGFAAVSRPATVSTAVNAAAVSRPVNAFWGLVKKELFSCAINPFYWIAALVFELFSAAAFFFGSRFFVQGFGSSSMAPFFLTMPYVLSVILPALCMNIKDRAFDQTLPFGEFEKAAARLFSALIAASAFLLPTLFVPLCVSLFGSVDFGATAVSYFGLLFYAAAAISFCVFLSGLFKSRTAYFSFAVLALSALNLVHSALNFVQLGDFLSEALRSISFAWRFDSASKGILDSRDFSFFALAAGRGYDGRRILVVTAFAMILVSPLLLFDVSFQLSFAATAGLLCLSPRLRAWGLFAPLPRALRDGLALTLGAQLATIPICAWYFHAVSLSSLVANLIVVPILELLMAAALFAGLLALALPFLARVVFAMDSLLLGLSYELTRALAALPMSRAYLPSMGWSTAAIYYAMLLYIAQTEEMRHAGFLRLRALPWRWMLPVCGAHTGAPA